MRTTMQLLAIVLVATSAGTGCAPARDSKYAPTDKSFSAYESAELESERHEFINERKQRLARIEKEVARLETRLAHESAFVDASTRVEWDQRLWNLRQQRAKLAAELERAQTAAPLEWREMRGDIATAIDILQADATKIGHEIAEAFSTDSDDGEARESSLCALDVPGATAVVETAHDRVELTVVTADAVTLPALRERAERLSRLREYRFRNTEDPDEVVSVPVQAWLETIAQGVKIVFDPQDQSQISALRDAISKNAQTLGKGTCSAQQPAISNRAEDSPLRGSASAPI